MSLQAEELVGRAVGRYPIDRLIGQGGFAWVYASRGSDGSPVAIKVLKPRYARDQEFETRFRNEFRVASELQHPNIVRIIDVGQTDGFTYFTMPLYPDSLASRLDKGATLGEEELVGVATDLAAGLAFAHETGIVHRDIKVDNVLLTDDGAAVIADFGIARAVSGYVSSTGVNMTIGTPHYISPEQAQGRALDGRSDLYALGVTLYKAATGNVPFRSSDWFELARMHVEEQPAAPSEKRPEISARLERVILKCLAKHPADRYPSAAALHDELAGIRSQNRETESFGTAPVTNPLVVEATGSRPNWLLIGVAVVIVVLVAVAVVLVSG